MFSSFARSIKSIAKGPRAVLAENIARVLSEHFVLDPKDIESSLLKDARIVLKNTQLRARNYRSDVVPNTVVSISGSVEEVVFSWRWSFGSGTSTSSTNSTTGGGMVQDVVLAIKGVKVRVDLDTWGTLDAETQALVETFESKTLIQNDSDDEATDLKQKETFLQKYVQQIVDNLTLRLEDFDVVLRTSNGHSINIAGKDLELGTLSSASSMLSQKISIGSVSANVTNGTSSELFPLIESFGYQASIVRFSGERFKGGILSGLEIIGLQPPPKRDGADDDDEGILFHIGLPQTQAVSAIGVMLVPSSSGEAKHGAPSRESTRRDAPNEKESSTFDLPLPALTIVLPPSGVDKIPTKITLPRATIAYRADGRVFRIEGREGIKDNGTSFVKLADDAKWSVDFVEKTINIGKDGGGCKISISDEALRRMSSSVTSISSTDHVKNMKDALEVRTTRDKVTEAPIAPEPCWSISTGSVELQLTGGDNHWLEVNVAHSHIKFSPEKKKLMNATIGESTVKSSFDDATGIVVRPVKYLSGKLHMSDTVEATFGSVEQALQMKNFALSFLELFEQSDQTQTTTLPDLPCPIEIDRIRLAVRESDLDIILKNIRGEGNSLSCELVVCNAGESKVESKNIHLNYQTSDLRVKVGSVLSLAVPGVFSLNEPVIDTSISYTTNGIYIDANKIHGTFERPKADYKKNGTNNKPAIRLPFPIKFDLKFLMMREAGKRTLFGMKQISASIKQSGSTFMIESQEGIKMKIQQSPELAIQASLGHLNLELQEDNGDFTVKQISLSGASLGPCSPSCGALFVTLPPLSKKDGEKLCFRKDIDISFDSVEVFDKLRPLYDSIVEPKEGDAINAFPFPIEVPGMKVSASNPPSTICIGATSADGTNIICGQVSASVQNLISISMKRLNADLIGRSLNVNCVESMQLPGIVELTRSFNNMNLKFVEGSLFLNMPGLVEARMVSKSTGMVSPKALPQGQQSAISIPFNINVNVLKLNLKTLRKGDQKCLQMEEISLGVSSAMIPAQDLLSSEMEKGAKISLEIENIEHDMFQVRKLQTSLMLELQGLETLHQLQLSLDSPRIEAGYSTNDWASLFQEVESNDGATQKVLKMPFARVARTSVFISYQSSVVESNTTIAIPEFIGNSLTTSEDMSAHYTNAVLQRIPGLLSNVNILGTNVVDGSFASMGKLALGAGSVTTAGVGSVVGTAAADGMKAAIAAGKSSRNATADESYKFGDITRGVISGMKHATQKGARSRGSNGSDYVPGDFTVGAAQSLGEYGGRNSKKLASAGASGAAATVGLAVAGPLGFVVGGYLGGKLVGGEQQTAQQQQQTQYNQQQVGREQKSQNQEQERRAQQGIPMVNGHLQQQQEIPMVNAQVITDTPIYAEPVMNRFENRRSKGNEMQRNGRQQHQQHMYHRPQSRQSHTHSSSIHGNQSSQYQQPQTLQNSHHQTQLPSHHQSQYPPHGQEQQNKSYKFGDLTRGIVARGKQADGRSQDSGYKFGDFTRGLFK